MKKILLIITLVLVVNSIYAQNIHDCIGAVSLCGNTYNQTSTLNEVGNIPNEINVSSGNQCLTEEVGGVWYTFTPTSTDVLNFSIIPASSTGEDYDWALFDLTGADCSDLSTGDPFSYLIAGNTAGEDDGFAPFINQGATGINSDSALAGTLSCVGPGAGDGSGSGPSDWNTFNTNVVVQTGHTYYLYVAQFDGSQGYTIDFSTSQASLFDSISPYLVSAHPSNCNGQSVEFFFSENVICSSLQNNEFTITGPTGIIHSISNISSSICSSGGTSDSIYSATVNPAMLQSGIYTFSFDSLANGSIQDACGNLMNSANVNFNINIPQATANVIQPTCTNNVGEISLTPIVSGSYTYVWTPNVSSNNTASNLPFGSYHIQINDTTCSWDTTIILNEPTITSVTSSVIQPTCGNNDGSINLTPNPSGSYSYTWSPNVSSTNSSINLLPDSYQINISQGVCSWDTTITLDVPTNCGCLSPLTLSVDSFFNTKCGGSSACNYSGPSILINEINLVPSANDGSIYGETGTSGVKEGEWIELYNPDWCNAVDISGYILGSYNSTAGAISASNGMGFMLPAGTVVPPLGFVVVRGRNTSVPTSSAIDIIVDDLGGNLCIDGGLTTSRIWFQNAGGWFGFYDASGVPQDIVQWGSTSASDLDGVPCIPPSSPIPSLLSANASGILYNLGATPSTGQTYVRIPDGGNWSTTTQSENSSYGTCNDLVGGCVIGNGGVSTCDGSATVNIVSGGTGPFTYQWNDALNQTTATADSLCPGTYCVIVTDSSGICFDTICVEILDSSKITFNVQINNPTCSNDDGNITLTPDSVGNYNYTWTPNVSSTNAASSLSGGVYQIQVTNGSCAWDTSITLTAPAAFMVSSNIVEPSCLDNDGSISLNPNLSGSYTYTWTPNVSSSNAATNLSSGTYQINVSDGSCDWDTTIIINTPTNSLTISSTLTHATCGNSNGGIIINASNGVGSLDYSIDNGTTSQTGNIFSGLLDGTYDIVVTDSLGCQAQEQVTINMFSSPTITNIIQVDENCTSTDGQITIIASGTSSLNYSIDNGITSQSSNVFSGLSAGTYDVVVTDANGCSITQQIVLGRINTVVANFVATPTNGLAPLEVDFTDQSTGATSYAWIFGDGNTSSLEDPSNTYLTFGDYTATLIATDSLGCSDTATMTIIVTDIFTILVPNIFTPNGDGSNDVFLIKSTFIDELNVKIFNRWGNKLYEINSPSDSWDGGDSSDGTYFYVLKAKGKGGEVVEKTGSVTLIR